MMKLKLSLKNSASLAFSTLLAILCIYGCSSSTKPSYQTKDIDKSLCSICLREYGIDVKSRLVGETLWIYIPVENLVQKAEKAEKYSEKFNIEFNESDLKGGLLEVKYAIKPIVEAEKEQEFAYNKETLEKVSNVWKVLRRVIFSTERSYNEPKFFVVITTDINNGFELRENFYYLDIKKVFYQFISWTEYQHRYIQGINLVPEAVGDKEGSYIDYHDITFEEFLTGQIQHRIKLKFQKPEVEPGVDIDKEVIKIVVNALKTYDFKGFYELRIENLFKNTSVVLNQAAVWARPIE